MTSWVTWGVFVGVAVALGVVGNYYSVRTVRLFTVATAIVLMVAVTDYGLTHPGRTPQAPQDLQTAFARGADAIAAALFHPLWMGHEVPEPGRVGWIVLALLLLIGYRQLEWRAFKQQAPVIDTSQLDQGQPSVEADLVAEGRATVGDMQETVRDIQVGTERIPWTRIGPVLWGGDAALSPRRSDSVDRSITRYADT